MVEVQILSADTIAGLRSIGEKVRDTRPLLVAVGKSGAAELRSWFFKRDTSPNKLGGRRTNFWRKMASSVSGPVLVGSGRVRIAVTGLGFSQKVYGGRITPKRAKALTIPITPESYGRTVSVFERESGIKLFLLKQKGGGLSRMLAGKTSGGIKVFYVLQPSVDQSPDPDALPPRAHFNAALLNTANSALRRAIHREGGEA